jgi:exopolysaccharide biosynthesis polyprenyl glycosylphosphotransferase
MTDAAGRTPAAHDALRRRGVRDRLAGRPWWRDSLRRRVIALADFCVACAAIISLDSGGPSRETALLLLAAAPIWIVIAKLQGLYDGDHRALRHLTLDEIPRLLVWSLAGTVLTVILLTGSPTGAPDASTATRTWVAAALGAVLFRSIVRAGWRRLTEPERVLVVGRGALAEATRRKLELFPDIHARIVAQLDTLPSRVEQHLVGVDRVILASSAIDEALIADLVRDCRSRSVKLSVVPPARGLFGTAVRLEHIADLPVIQYNTWDISRSTAFLKRVIDVAVALPAVVLLSPLLAAIALAVRLDSRGPALYVQQRAGLGGRPFRIYKFRTMVVEAEEALRELVQFETLREPMFKLENDPRVTGVGRVLRRTSLDELPQLFNVARGDMSLVGPRPEQLELVARYSPEHRFRMAVKPGLTGPMQVYGRGQLGFEERLAVEREYVENLSLGRDVRILTLTLAAVVTGRGAY